MSYQCNKKYFVIQTRRTCLQIPWLSLMVLLLISGIFLSLSHWQYQRYQSQTALAKAWAANKKKPVLTVEQASDLVIENNKRNIRITGHFVPKKNVLIDNAMYQHTPGYQVVSPFEADEINTWLLVNRGWIPSNHHQSIPTLPETSSEITLEGRLYCPQKHPIMLNKHKWLSSPENQFPIVVQTLDVGRIGQNIGHPVAACYLQLSSPNSIGFMREWHDNPITPDRHMAYALQWFFFAFVAWVVFYLRHRKKRA